MNEHLRTTGIIVADVGLAMVVFYGLTNFVSRPLAAAVMLLVLGTVLYTQGIQEDEQSPEEKVLGGDDVE